MAERSARTVDKQGFPPAQSLYNGVLHTSRGSGCRCAKKAMATVLGLVNPGFPQGVPYGCDEALPGQEVTVR